MRIQVGRLREFGYETMTRPNESEKPMFSHKSMMMIACAFAAALLGTMSGCGCSNAQVETPPQIVAPVPSEEPETVEAPDAQEAEEEVQQSAEEEVQLMPEKNADGFYSYLPALSWGKVMSQNDVVELTNDIHAAFESEGMDPDTYSECYDETTTDGSVTKLWYSAPMREVWWEITFDAEKEEGSRIEIRRLASNEGLPEFAKLSDGRSD